MSLKLDKRLGRELGLDEFYADVPAFQIVNDAESCMNGLNAAITSLGYGPQGAAVRQSDEWDKISEKGIFFTRELRRIGTDPVKAAVLQDQINDYYNKVIVPFQDQLSLPDHNEQSPRQP